MKKYLILPSLAAAILFGTNASAQSQALSTGYFTDGYIYKTKLNPALTPNCNNFGFLIGNINLSSGSNLSLSDFLYDNGENLVTFAHPSISDEQALRNVKETNRVNGSYEMNFLNVGFFNNKGTIYSNISLDSRAYAYSTLPGDIFRLIKSTENDREYNMDGLSTRAYAYNQISFSQSYAVGKEKKVRVGYAAKLLFGLTRADLNYSTLRATAGSEKITFDAEGSLTTEGFYFKAPADGEGNNYLNLGQIGFRVNSDGSESVENLIWNTFSNLGFAADLGVTWEPFDYLQISASIQDLGFISWKHGYTSSAAAHAVYDGSAVTTADDAQTEFSNFVESIGSLAQYSPDYEVDSEGRATGEGTTTTEMLPVIGRLGIQFRLPAYKKVSIGLLYSKQFHRSYDWWETRLSINYDVARWFSFSISTAPGSLGTQFGALLNIHTSGFNFFAGMDNIPLAYTANGVPLKTGTVKASAGINILFGKYFGRYPKKEK